MTDLGRVIVAERAAFADTLERVGPDAPTLAGTWTAADVAAHVLSLDRVAGVPTAIGRWLVGRGVRLNDRAAKYADRALQSTKRKGFDWAVRSFRTPGPRLLRRDGLAPIGLFEVFVHHEDVRRASGAVAGRAVPPELLESVQWLLRYHSSLLDGVRLIVRTREPSNELVAGTGDDVVLEGDLGEVVLWLAGRRDVADVTLDGAPDAVGRVTSARLVV